MIFEVTLFLFSFVVTPIANTAVNQLIHDEKDASCGHSLPLGCD